MDPDLLRKVREQSGLRLDREGRFWHRGDLLEHARTIAALHRGLHRAEDGRWAVRIGPGWAYVEVEDAGYVRVPDGDRARLTRAAQLSLADHLREEAGDFWLELAGRRHRIGQDG